tara:strand:+ start:329 stop:547 length:219 start_codon:yes stop_codon:yes gene_type:complete
MDKTSASMLKYSLIEMGKRINTLLDFIPEDITWEPGEDPSIDEAADAILAIEEEWIIDEDQRREFSVIEFDH